MPTIKIPQANYKKDLNKNEPIKDACEEAGMIFGCSRGNCGTCLCTVTKGENLLSKKNDKERMLLGDDNPSERLACQCTIASDKDGDIVIEV